MTRSGAAGLLVDGCRHLVQALQIGLRVGDAADLCALIEETREEPVHLLAATPWRRSPAPHIVNVPQIPAGGGKSARKNFGICYRAVPALEVSFP